MLDSNLCHPLRAYIQAVLIHFGIFEFALFPVLWSNPIRWPCQRYSLKQNQIQLKLIWGKYLQGAGENSQMDVISIGWCQRAEERGPPDDHFLWRVKLRNVLPEFNWLICIRKEICINRCWWQGTAAFEVDNQKRTLWVRGRQSLVIYSSLDGRRIYKYHMNDMYVSGVL